MVSSGDCLPHDISVRAYLEQNGKLSVFQYEQNDLQPGLPLVPPWDIVMPELYPAGSPPPGAGHFACSNCGLTVAYELGEVLTICPNCHHGEWTKATENPLRDD